MAKSTGKRRAAKPAKKAKKAKSAKPVRRSKSARKAGASRKTAAVKARAGRKASKSTAKKKTARAAKPKARAAKKIARRRATPARPPAARATAKAAAKTPAKRPAPKAKAPEPAARRAPTLDRERRRISDSEVTLGPPSSLNLDRSASAARSGRADLVDRLQKHTSTGPDLTAGDVDADWEAAESVGDEAPGGDNPTPDQDVVDDIGKALGVEYDDDEELQGGEEIVDRDRNRWELDPASRDDFEDE
jgi:hypothetical protein